jgi:hypothetical protein
MVKGRSSTRRGKHWICSHARCAQTWLTGKSSN